MIVSLCDTHTSGRIPALLSRYISVTGWRFKLISGGVIAMLHNAGDGAPRGRCRRPGAAWKLWTGSGGRGANTLST